MKENILIDKSIDFGARIVKLHRYLSETKHESIISKQILRSGTSIGANINEAQYGNSKADFIAKLHIALKETAETEYWLHILQKSEYLDDSMAASMLNDCLEIKRILITSINTAKQKNDCPPLFRSTRRVVSCIFRACFTENAAFPVHHSNTQLALL